MSQPKHWVRLPAEGLRLTASIVERGLQIEYPMAPPRETTASCCGVDTERDQSMIGKRKTSGGTGSVPLALFMSPSAMKAGALGRDLLEAFAWNLIRKPYGQSNP